MAQYLRPDATLATGGWTAVGASTGYAAVDEVTQDDNDYLDSQESAGIVELGLTAPGSVPSTTGSPEDCLVRFAASRERFNKNATLTVTVTKAGTPIASAVATAANPPDQSPWQNYTALFDSTSVGSGSSDWSDLRVDLEHTVRAGVNGYISWIEVVVPDGATAPTVTTSLESVIQKQMAQTALLDSALQVSGVSLTSLNAALARVGLVTTDADAALRAAKSALAQADAVLRDTFTVAGGIDARLELASTTYTVTTSLAAALMRQALVTHGADAALLREVLITTGLDAQLYAVGTQTITTDLDAAMVATAIATASIEAALAATGTVSTGVDAGLALLGSVTASLESALQRLRSATAALDAALRSTVILTANLDARLNPSVSISAPTPGRTLNLGARNRTVGVYEYPRRLYVDDQAQRTEPPAAVVGIGAYDAAFGDGFD